MMQATEHGKERKACWRKDEDRTEPENNKKNRKLNGLEEKAVKNRIN